MQTSIEVAPASNAFSTSSFTDVARSKTTCPEQILCTEVLSIGFMLIRFMFSCRFGITSHASKLAVQLLTPDGIIPSLTVDGSSNDEQALASEHIALSRQCSNMFSHPVQPHAPWSIHAPAEKPPRFKFLYLEPGRIRKLGRSANEAMHCNVPSKTQTHVPTTSDRATDS
jgi:hypothetical protein